MRTIESLMGSPTIHGIGWGLLHSLWQSTAVALMLALVLRRLHRGPAEGRYLVACAALIMMVTLPVATSSMLSPVAGPLDGVGSAESARRPGTIDSDAEQLATLGPRSFPHPVWLPLPGQTRALLPTLVAAWMVGIIVHTLRLLGGWLVVQRLRRRQTRPVAAPADVALARLAGALRIRRRVRLLESQRVKVPMVIGTFRPVILLPIAALAGLTPGQLEALLTHELAHIRRHDYLVNLVQSAIEILLFYHPAAWWVSRVIRTEREHCCDDLAVRACGDRLTYARALAAMEGLRGAPYLSLAVTGSPLMARVRRILNLEVETLYRLPIVGPGFAVLLGSLLLANATAQQTGRSPQDVANPRLEGRSSPALVSQGTTIYVPLFRSVSLRRNVQFQLTELVQKEIEKRTPHKVVGRLEDADTILEGTINIADKEILAEKPSELPRELTVTFNASVNWVHNPPLENERNRVPTVISKKVTFVPERDEPPYTAFYRTCQSMAEQIVKVMELTSSPSDGSENGMTPNRPIGGQKPNRGLDQTNLQEAERIFLIGDYYRRTGKVATAKYYFDKLRRVWPQSKWAALAENRAQFLDKAVSINMVY